MKEYPSWEMLNLFSELLAQGSLSLAADNLQLPVSTASRYLSAMRAFYGEELFVRSKTGLLPTRRALEIGRDVDLALKAYRKATNPQKFDLSTCVREVRIVCADNALFSRIPQLVKVVKRAAPGVRLVFMQGGDNAPEMLRRKDIDFVIAPTEGDLGEGIHSLTIGRNYYSLIGAGKHPLAIECRAKQSAAEDEEVMRYEFIDVLLSIRRTDKVLRDVVFPSWKGAKTVAKTQFFLPFVTALNESDYLMVVPERTALLLQKSNGIEIIPTKTQGITDQPRVIWHQTSDGDVLMQWLRSVIYSCGMEGEEPVLGPD